MGRLKTSFGRITIRSDQNISVQCGSECSADIAIHEHHVPRNPENAQQQCFEVFLIRSFVVRTVFVHLQAHILSIDKNGTVL